MNLRNLLFLVACYSLAAVACDNDDDDAPPCAVEGGELSGGPFAFTVDGIRDTVGDVTLSGESGALMAYLVTDADGTILGVLGTVADVLNVDFDGNDPGTCQIYHLSFQRDLVGADVGRNLSELSGCHDLSNAVDVVRSACPAEGGTLSGGPFAFAIDGEADLIEDGDLTLADAVGDSTGYLITTPDSATVVAVGNEFGDLDELDFNAFAADTFLVWATPRNSAIVGAAPGAAVADLAGCFALSTAVQVTQSCGADGGTLTGGPFLFRLDGEADFIAEDELSLAGASGDTTTYVVTDADGVILGLPPTAEALSGVDFNTAGEGTCLVWHLAYNSTVTGLAVDANANDLAGCFDLSDPVTVQRVCAAEGGSLQGGPFSFAVDGESDFVDTTLLVLSGEEGSSSTFVVTDADGVILQLPSDFEDLSEIDFDAAGVGTCLLWHLSFNGELGGAEVNANASNLTGCFDLSDPVTVERVCGSDGGTLEGGPFAFTVDGTPDNIDTSMVSLSGAVGGSMTYVITEADSTILSLPGDLAALARVDFDQAGPGTCLLWHLSFTGTLEGAAVDSSAVDLAGDCFDLSNPLEIVRSEP